jgi:hypothetical protein
MDIQAGYDHARPAGRRLDLQVAPLGLEVNSPQAVVSTQIPVLGDVALEPPKGGVGAPSLEELAVIVRIERIDEAHLAYGEGSILTQRRKDSMLPNIKHCST